MSSKRQLRQYRFSSISLRLRVLLVALPASALLAFVVGFFVSSFAEQLFLRDSLDSKMSLARAIARAIDGDVHRGLDSHASTRDPTYRRTLSTLSGIMADERGVTNIYTLNYDPATDRLTYVLDARIALRDLLGIETEAFSFAVSFDEKGRALLEINQKTHVESAIVNVRGRSVCIRVTNGPGTRELLVDNVSLAAFGSLDPLQVATPAGALDREQRALRTEVLFDGRPTAVHYSFAGRGESRSDPGSVFVGSEENVARTKTIIRSGKDSVERERRDNNGMGIGAYGIIRDRSGASVGAVFVDLYDVGISHFRQSLRRVVYPVSVLAFGLALAGLLALSRLIVVPLRRLTAAVAAVAEGDLGVRIPTRSSDEIGSLARGFNSMVEALSRNLSAQRRSEERLADLAYKDELTGLLNRKSFYDRLAETLNQARRSEHEKLRGLLFLDLDHFKDVNDSMGHDFGDQLLRQVADRLRAQVRESDYVFRQGGDEFTVVLSALARETDAAIVAQKLIDSLEEPFEIQGSRLHIGTSIGIAIFPRDGESVEQLVKNADTALFDAKKERHVFRFFTREMQNQALAKIELINRLLRSLEGGKLELHYQPQFDATSRVVGVEALLRWPDGLDSSAQPEQLIPLAEETGAILPIGKWVLGAACLQARDLRAAGIDRVPVYVNVTARELMSRDFLSVVDQAVAATGIEPSALGLEITERALTGTEGAAERLGALAARGLCLVIDHFGAGASSLASLETLAIKAVKIDSRLVRSVDKGRMDAEIVKAIAALSYACGRQVIAVGVERADQARLLRSLGCEVLQGFHLCPPLPGPDLVAFLSGPDDRLR